MVVPSSLYAVKPLVVFHSLPLSSAFLQFCLSQRFAVVGRSETAPGSECLGGWTVGFNSTICNLKKRLVNVTLREHDSPLLVAPEIVDYGLVHALAEQLQHRLNSAWTTEHLNDDSLTYLVGVTQTGAIAAYSPINLPAVEQVHEIPLPALTDADRLRRQDAIEPLAHFEVTFLPSGSLQINAWCGVPLMKVAWSMLIATLSLSAIVSVSIGLLT